MASIYDADASFVYAWEDNETKTLNIGLKTPQGESKFTYITSCESPDFWERYSKGKMERTILFVGSELKARAAEWFAMDFGFKTGRKFFNLKNNAHVTDESILLAKDKEVIVKFLRGEGQGIEFGSSDSTKAQRNKDIVTSIAQRVEGGKYTPVLIPLSEALKFNRSQVRVEMDNLTAVSKISQRMLEDPERAKETFKPISVVVRKDGSKLIVNGNTRLKAAQKTPGWNEVPVVFINESEFGSTEKIRQRNFVQYGLYMNREEFEVRVTNSKDDLKRNITNFLVEEKIDLSKPMHVDRARHLIYENFDYTCGSKQQLNGILTSILSDFEKHQAELSYQKNIISYDDKFFKDYSWDNYGKKDISTIHATVGEAANAKPLAYICRVMTKEKSDKGAIILHYTNKQELVSEEKHDWIGDLKRTIKYMKLPIVVDVLPAFEE
jgi:hypothetical protein